MRLDSFSDHRHRIGGMNIELLEDEPLGGISLNSFRASALFEHTFDEGMALVEECARARRSEEHTSELQSHLNLVCRLLLEKKKKRFSMETGITYGANCTKCVCLMCEHLIF